MPSLKHFDNLGTVRFITFSCFRRIPLLKSEEDVSILLRTVETKRLQKSFSVLGYVIMPNHVHLVLYPRTSLKMGQVIGEIKKESAFSIIRSWEQKHVPLLKEIRDMSGRRQRYAFWLPRCFDHNCRTPDVVREKINYCHNNPVRAGLVDNPDQWPWSSSRWYNGDRRGILQVEEFPL